MKIIGGAYKNRNFYMPVGVKPTQNISRKAVFDMVGSNLQGKVFLDLFSGSGAMGLEALSRGVTSAVFVEKDEKCYNVINDNIQILRESGCEAKVECFNQDVFVGIKFLAQKNKKFDVIFADPPYARDLAKKVLKNLGAYDIMNSGSLLFLESHKKERLPESTESFLLLKVKSYGLANIWVYALL